ncbi:translation initiation factor eIF-1A [Candidatus Pacearchaeota archaeon]|nr:translation initiation factor eIF-1A [Candidatus Pacearchaeota archaeon]
MEDEENEFGDFEEILDESENQEETPQEQEGFVRARWPKKEEIIGIIVQRYGGNRMEVLATDGKTRNCRVPGKYKRQLWLRPKDIILIKLWEFDKKKGDIIYKYRPNEVTQLRKKGLLDSLTTGF